jgi:hypothetical protein
MNIHLKTLVICLLALLMLCIYVDVDLAVAQTNAEQSSLEATNIVIDQAFNDVLAAEKAGANVTGLVNKLNGATALLTEAENAYRNGNLIAVEEKADAAFLIARNVSLEAQIAQEKAQNSTAINFWFTLALTILGIIILFFVLFIVWIFIKRSYIKDLNRSKPQVITDET